jgi:hypothetical protein
MLWSIELLRSMIRSDPRWSKASPPFAPSCRTLPGISTLPMIRVSTVVLFINLHLIPLQTPL